MVCFQLGLPISCLNTVPVSNQLGFVQKMDVGALEALIEEDKAAGKMPVLVVAYAGTYTTRPTSAPLVYSKGISIEWSK